MVCADAAVCLYYAQTETYRIMENFDIFVDFEYECRITCACMKSLFEKVCLVDYHTGSCTMLIVHCLHTVDSGCAYKSER